MVLPFPHNRPRGSSVVLGRNTKTGNDITISIEERTSGMHVLGGTGTGKSTLATRVFLRDIINGHGGVFFDVEGDSITDLLPHIPEERMQDVLLLDLVELAEQGHFIGINPLAGDDIPSDVDRAVQIFKMLWEIVPGTPRLENTLRLCLLTLAYNGLTIAEIKSLLEYAAFRKQCVDRLPHTYVWDKVRGYWEDDYNKLPLYVQRERADTILNKVYQLETNPYTSYAITQNTTTLKFRELMDQNKIILLRMSLKMLGKDTVRFLGTFLMSELKNALFSRADVAKKDRPFFSLVADEWQLYITPDFDDILTRGRKYGCGAMVLNQTLSQLFEVNRALVGITEQLNTHVTFRVGVNDAETLATLYYHDPQPEVQEKYASVISPTPVDTVIKRPHTNQFVNEFFKPWREIVQMAHGSIREGSTPDSSSSTITRRGTTKINIRPGRSWSNRGAVEGSQELLDIFNGLLYEVMSEKKPSIPVPLDLFGWLIINTDEETIIVPNYSPFHDYVALLLQEPTEEQIRFYNALFTSDDASFAAACSAYEKAVRAFLQARIKITIQYVLQTIVADWWKKDTLMSSSAKQTIAALNTNLSKLLSSPSFVLTPDDLKAIPVHFSCREQWSKIQNLTPYLCVEDGRRLKPGVTSGGSLHLLVIQSAPDMVNTFKWKSSIQKEDVEETCKRVMEFVEKLMRQEAQKVNYPNTKGLEKDIAEWRSSRGISFIPSAFNASLFDPYDYVDPASLTNPNSINYREEFYASEDMNIWIQKYREAIIYYIREKCKDLYKFFYLGKTDYAPPREFVEAEVKKWRFCFSGTCHFDRQIEINTNMLTVLELLFDKYEGMRSRPILTFSPNWQQALRGKIQAELDRLVSQQKPTFEEKVRNFRKLIEILAQEPVMELSSVVEEKPSGQRTFADMEKEKAKELVGLPNGKAYVAIGSRGDRFNPDAIPIVV